MPCTLTVNLPRHIWQPKRLDSTRNERRTTMKKKLNIYEEPKIEILVLDVKDVITASGSNPFMGEEVNLSGYFGQENGLVD